MSEPNMDSGQLAEMMPELEVQVYEYMKKVYDELAEAGEKYDEAKNDTYAEQKASRRFNVTAEEAAKIYAKAESQLRRRDLKR
ncbi:hypothetical protein [Bacillus piscicola]|uniref:hypothetical protein n=1 Tax=Bacillus piscicola TaxID=1632684 RepID=UPI001F08BAE0|nr:hypothetical protein [Bacillus piscicola]